MNMIAGFPKITVRWQRIGGLTLCPPPGGKGGWPASRHCDAVMHQRNGKKEIAEEIEENLLQVKFDQPPPFPGGGEGVEL